MAVRIQNGMMTPNEAREKDDMGAYPDGDKYYMAGNILPIQKEQTEEKKQEPIPVEDGNEGGKEEDDAK